MNMDIQIVEFSIIGTIRVKMYLVMDWQCLQDDVNDPMDGFCSVQFYPFGSILHDR